MVKSLLLIYVILQPNFIKPIKMEINSFEGAQGISLDVDHGIYPFTTSSNTATGHISTGTGVSYRELNRVIGVVKGT